MSRKISEVQPYAHRPLFSIIAGVVSLAAVAACGGTVDTSSDTSAIQAQALTEAQSSFADTKAAAEACFATFETCKSAAGADLAACEAALHSCLPEKAGPGPHCGGGPKGGHHGDHDGDGPKDCHDGAPPPPGSGDAPPPPPPGGAGGPPPPPPGGDGAPHHPDFCKKVPLPPSPELKACHDTLHACVSGGGDRKACFDADRACVKAAFDAAFAELCAATDKDERLTKLCAGGVAPTP